MTVAKFSAEWCGPCKAIAPLYARLSTQYDGKDGGKKLNFLHIDVDKCRDVAHRWEVKAMPTFMVFRSGQKLASLVGASGDALERLVKENSK